MCEKYFIVTAPSHLEGCLSHFYINKVVSTCLKIATNLLFYLVTFLSYMYFTPVVFCTFVPPPQAASRSLAHDDSSDSRRVEITRLVSAYMNCRVQLFTVIKNREWKTGFRSKHFPVTRTGLKLVDFTFADRVSKFSSRPVLLSFIWV